MDLRFIAPSLRRLDLAGTEVICGCLAEQERPPHGVAGLLDWRLAGEISRLILRGFASGALGEVLLLTGKPKLPFDKVLLFGVGDQDHFDEGVFELVVDRMLSTLEGLRARSAVVQLPGRHWDAIDPERAAGILLERSLGNPHHDLWTLVESAEAQRQIQKQLVTERRRHE